LPHSEISGSPGARPSPELFAACHVLHRLSVPRHPPDALLVLAHAQPQGRAFPRCPGALHAARPCRGNAPRRICIPIPGHDRSAAQDPRVEAASPVMPASRSRLASRCQNVSRPTPPCRARAPISSVRAAPGAAAPSPRSHPRLLVGLGRFERPTSRLSGVRSNQLSYRPGCREQRSEIRRHPRQNLISVSVLWKGCAGGGRGQIGDPAGVPSLAAGPGGPAMVAAKRAWQPLERR
jgi:hypothetical protein